MQIKYTLLVLCLALFAGFTLLGQTEPMNSMACDDGNPCTIDIMDDCGNCFHIRKKCDDGDPTTVDSCDPQTGDCTFTPIVCDDGNPDTFDFLDENGVCHHVYAVCCDDGDPCTIDTFNPQTGACVNTPDPACLEDLCPDDPDKEAPGICGCGVPDTDSDGDGTPDCNDDCPNDPDKTKPGDCGCGTPDTDSDGDGTPDCKDRCPNDPDKTKPGDCGCGNPDVDEDGDGMPDCEDLCPDDPDKIAPGICGCGTPDTDSDGDGTPDCKDRCPNDPDKTKPGDCGCGVSDVDTDGDGTPDCDDDCPNDPDKTKPGDCGCGVSDVDTDGDGTPDCDDDCPNDPDKTKPGDCGCGVSDVDTDGDGTPDCKDRCPNDPNKTKPGVCGCGVSDVDTDGDGTPDCNDPCPENPDPNCEENPCAGLTSSGCLPEVTAIFEGCDKVTVCSAKDLSNVVLDLGPAGFQGFDVDQKYDGLSGYTDMFSAEGINGVWIKSGCNSSNDCPGCGEYVSNPYGPCTVDLCPNDPNKTEPGECGCGTPDTDSDGDGTPDCNDPCDDSIDSDNDGTPDCKDRCPNDPNKTKPGDCGCGVSDIDTDRDGTPDCNDPCPENPDPNCGEDLCEGLTSNGCRPEFNVRIDDNCEYVEICSSKDLSNIVFDYGPRGFQNFNIDVKADGLSGTTTSFSTEGLNGVWIKSGCNSSNDCPGCGEYFSIGCNPVAPSESTSRGMQVFPNPTNNELFIDLNAYRDKSATIEVFNTAGTKVKVVEVDKIQQEAIRLILPNLPNGVYIIKVNIPEEGILTEEFIYNKL